MSTQMRGFAPAMRVMSRSEPPACASGSWPSMREAPVWFATMFASTCGTWLVIATSRSCASASIATGVAPSAVANACTARCRSGSVCAIGRQEPGRAFEERRARVVGAARLGAADRVSADEAGRAVRGAHDGGLRGADVGHGRVGGRGEDGGDGRRELGDRRSDDDELGVLDRVARGCRPVRARRAPPRARARRGRDPSRRRRRRAAAPRARRTSPSTRYR